MESVPTVARGDHERAVIRRMEVEQHLFVRRVRAPANACVYDGLVRKTRQEVPHHFSNLDKAYFGHSELGLAWLGHVPVPVGVAWELVADFDPVVLRGLKEEAMKRRENTTCSSA